MKIKLNISLSKILSWRSDSSTTSRESSNASSASDCPSSWRTFRAKHADSIGAAGGWIGFKIAGIQSRIVVGVGELVSKREPSGANCGVTAEKVQATTTETEPLTDVKDLVGLLHAAELVLLRNYQIYVDIGVNKIAVCRASNSPLNSHQAVLLRSLENCVRLEDFGMSGRRTVRSDPANVFTAPKAPLLQAVSAHVEALGASAPEEHKRPMRRN